jgi:aerobic carbon-monoxide dehydrogenase small subunit
VTPIALTVNGRKVQALVEPRTHLGDFLREHCRLTGTHLGCEHGVCGACTVLIDGEPARSCITYAVACDGLAIETIEGFAGDPVMRELREAFSREHGLQCGFCTPGMLIAARDIVRRLPGADERRIRVELSGNLCRCTGYLGIVNAVRSVIETQAASPTPVAAPAPSAARFTPFGPSSTEQALPTQQAPPALEQGAARKGWTRFEESFVVVKPPAIVWDVFADVPAVAACLPGAELTDHDQHSAKGKMTVKLGPILAAFAGSAVIERDDQALRGVIRGAGSDRGTGSRTKGDVVYRLAPEGDDRTRVSIIVEYSLQGALAQFSRSSLAQDLGRRLVADFALNLNAKLTGTAAAPETPSAPLNVGRLAWLWLRARLRRFFGG